MDRITQQEHGVLLLRVPLLEDTGLVQAAFTTRVGGVSQGECSSMNFSFSRKDEPEAVRENFRRLCETLGTRYDRLVITRQVHEDRVLEPEEADLNGHYTGCGTTQEADALITDRPGWALVKHAADCVPILLLDPVQKAVAAVHAGWRGTVASIAQKTVRRMAERFGSRPQDILAAIGPSIGPCCFQVGEDVAHAFRSAFPQMNVALGEGSETFIDLWACNKSQLLEAGLLPGHVSLSGLCTACHPEWFYSHRRDQGRCGAMVGVIALVE